MKKTFKQHQIICDLERDIEVKNVTIKELTSTLAEKDAIIERYKNSLEATNTDVSELKKLIKNTPEDCKPGDYCKACEFGKEFKIRMTHPNSICYYDQYVTICCKGGACSNFVKKED